MLDRPPELPALSRTRRLNIYRVIRSGLGALLVAYVAWRLYEVLVVKAEYGPDTWLRFAISGLVLGSVYSLIAIGYTLVYGILRMINFAHGDVMMLGAFGGYFVLEALSAIPVASEVNPPLTFLNAHPILAVILAFACGMSIAALSGFFLERIVYHPLRRAPRLAPLIGAIGASVFLENAAQLLFGPQRRDYNNPFLLLRGAGWLIPVGTGVRLTYTGVLTFVLSLILMLGLYLLVYHTRLGCAMRAVAEDKQTAALMGIDVDHVISLTFVISGALAGAAGVMWGLHNGLVYYLIGFVPGLKAFTAAVLGGIGNVPGTLFGGLLLGTIESVGPAALGIDFQLKDVIAFLILILVLLFRPAGLLGEVSTEETL